MNDNVLTYNVLPGDDLRIQFQVLCNEELVYETEGLADREDEVIRVCNELVDETGADLSTTEQQVADIVVRERKQRLRERDRGKDAFSEKNKDENEDADEDENENQDQGEDQNGDQNAPNRYMPIYGKAELPGEDKAPAGIWDTLKERYLTNFVLAINEDVDVHDDIEPLRVFRGTLTIAGRATPFEITAKDYSDNNKLRAALFAAGGPQIVFYGRIDELRTAISSLSGRERPIPRRASTTNFGWTPEGDAYLTPGEVVTAQGIMAVEEHNGVSVDLGGEELARHLGLRRIDDDELRRVKQHIVDDLLQCHDRRVTYCLLAATALAVLLPFADGVGRPALWLTGLTGTGKSFLAKLFANFFGSFPINGEGRFATWSATANYLQRQGYFFKDATYLVDDYKPEVIQSQNVIRILQNYADGTGRGRLRSDATTNVSRPIRGLLVSTGEDIPESSASVAARSIVVPVPQTAKDLQRGGRCVAQCSKYSAVTGAFIRWLLNNSRTTAFSGRVSVWQQRYYSDVVGSQNDVRIATNFALMAAAFEQLAEYLGPVWPAWEAEVLRFTEEDLIEIRNDMLGEVKDQQGSEVFMNTLAELIRHGQVRIEGHQQDVEARDKPVIGRVRQGADAFVLPAQRPGHAGGAIFEISTARAREAVQESLRKQARKPVQLTDRSLRAQLRQDGWLLGSDGLPLPLDQKGEATQRTRLQGQQTRCFLVSKRRLLED